MISGGKAPDPKFEQVRFSEADAKFMRTAIEEVVEWIRKNLARIQAGSAPSSQPSAASTPSMPIATSG
jgi:hypothetical protein